MNKIFLSLLLIFSLSSQAQLLVASEKIYPQLKGAEVYQSEDQVIIVFDGSRITSIEQVHVIIATALKFPETYEKNLVSLREYLTKSEYMPVLTQFVFERSQQMRAQIGAEKYEDLIQTLQTVKQSKGNLELTAL